MSTAIVYYSGLDSAQAAASKTAKRLSSYADELKSGVYKKLSNYSGEDSGNISEAKRQISEKETALRKKSSAYENYAAAIRQVKNECVNTDSRVAQRIASDSETFRANNDIKINVLDNISSFFTGLASANWFTRAISQALDGFKTGLRDLKSAVGNWFKYQGGKYYVWENAKVVLEVIAAVAGAVAAVAAAIAGSTVLAVAAAVAAVVLAVAAVVHGAVNAIHNQKAGDAAKDGDAALAVRLNDTNTLQDYIRTWTTDKTAYQFAAVLDVVEFSCKCISLVKSGTDLVKGSYQWLTNTSKADFKWSNMKWADLKTGIKNALSTAKAGLKGGGLNLKNAIKSGVFNHDWDSFYHLTGTGIREFSKTAFGDIIDMFKVTNIKTAADVKKVASGVKSISEITNNLLTWTALGDRSDFLKELISFTSSGFQLTDPTEKLPDFSPEKIISVVTKSQSRIKDFSKIISADWFSGTPYEDTYKAFRGVKGLAVVI